MDQNATDHGRLRITVRGIVQGVGFRPWIHRLATECGCAGFVCNTGDGVLIEVEGAGVQDFLSRLPHEAPAASMITAMVTVLTEPLGDTEFRIVHSEAGVPDGGFIPADLATCPDCLRELFDPSDRRHLHPFISCTNCGPRFSITASLPYDRPSTSMRGFGMCPRCAAEYSDPSDRRFHAQPIACHDCGPQLWFEDGVASASDTSEKSRTSETELFDGPHAAVDDPVSRAASLLQRGGIVALRGLGGYHLAVDATDAAAVARLRMRKRRDAKPFAVMVPDLDTARTICSLGPAEEHALASSDAPVVLARRRGLHETSGSELPGIADEVAPGLDTLGIMLPSTPLHHLLLRAGFRALVMTSGNVSDEPICIAPDEAAVRLAGIADGFLHHDRDILQRCDDSVVRVLDGIARPLRRARGFAPRPVLLAHDGPAVFATGAEWKSAPCFVQARTAHPVQHLGDLSTYETFRFFEEAALHCMQVHALAPQAVAHDMHPDYLSTRWALDPPHTPFAEALAGLPRIAVQHHHAHFASCLAENHEDGTCIGIILDGTGWGTDGTLWGGEFLVGDCAQTERAGHMLAVPMPGGERAIRAPWRMAAAWLHAAFGDRMHDVFPEFFTRRSAEECAALDYALATGVNTPRTSGCGRLLDAVSSLAGVCDEARYEAEAAMRLEALAVEPGEPYPWDILDGTSSVLSFQQTVAEIVRDVRSGVPAPVIASRMHATLVASCADMTERIARERGIRTVALSGGVFQNRIIFEGLTRSLSQRGFRVHAHRWLPPNDGGIAFGQAAAARARMQRG